MNQPPDHRNRVPDDSVTQLLQDLGLHVDRSLRKIDREYRDKFARLQEQQRLREEAEKARAFAEEERLQAIRREKDASARLDQEKRKAIEDLLTQLGGHGILTKLDTLLKSEATGNEDPTLVTIRTELIKWIRDITRKEFGADLERIYDAETVIVSRSEISSLCDFVPHNPFSDEYPRAECRVLDTGWRIAGGIILERARLEVVKTLPPQTPEALAISESSSHQGEMPMEITAAQPTEIQIPAVTTPPMCSGIAIEHQVAVDSGEGSPESTAQHQEETAAATIIAAGQSPTEKASPIPSVAPDITPDSSVQVAAKEDKIRVASSNRGRSKRKRGGHRH